MVRYVFREEAETIRAFVGISFLQCSKAKYAVTFQNSTDGRIISYPVQEVQNGKNGHLDYDLVSLIVINRICQIIAQSKSHDDSVNVEVYCGSHLISFIWEKEYKQQSAFSETTNHIGIWREISRAVEENNIMLTIHGDGSAMDSMNRSEIVRASHA